MYIKMGFEFFLGALLAAGLAVGIFIVVSHILATITLLILKLVDKRRGANEKKRNIRNSN